MFKVRLPEYHYPRNAWRRGIHNAVVERLKQKNINYTKEDKLEIHIRLYFDKGKISFVDVGNRLKDVMDALQGRIGGTKSKHGLLKPIVPNDSQIYRVTIEKCPPPPQSHGMGHLIIKRYSGPNYR